MNNLTTRTISKRDSISWRNLAALILIVLVCFRSIGFLLDSPQLDLVGRTLLVSPLPMPFGSYNNYENFSTKVNVSVYYHNGQIELIDLTTAYRSLSGPHRAKIVYVWAVLMGPIYSQKITAPVYNSLFCTNDLIKFKDKVFYVDIAYISGINDNKTRHYTRLCKYD